VWKRISNEDFIAFYDHVKEAADVARKAYDASLVSEQVQQWRALFGNEFPVMTDEEARCERLAVKARQLETGTATLGSSINIIRNTTGVTVPRERNYYDWSDL
jgi:hypothetical protein